MVKCQFTDCVVKHAVFNIHGESKGIYCVKHRAENMVNVKDKTCIEVGCDILPIYNLPTET